MRSKRVARGGPMRRHAGRCSCPCMPSASGQMDDQPPACMPAAQLQTAAIQTRWIVVHVVEHGGPAVACHAPNSTAIKLGSLRLAALIKPKRGEAAAEVPAPADAAVAGPEGATEQTPGAMSKFAIAAAGWVQAVGLGAALCGISLLGQGVSQAACTRRGCPAALQGAFVGHGCRPAD